uniref:Alpha-2-HS-glycoprotein n=1 Tax=Ailuropoda melanoleuca TaxID=9646 RepID=G1L2K2_AILME
MRSLALLLCLAQLCSCRSIPLGTALTYRQLNCDDPETEQAALAAVDYINSHMLQGYKHTLNQIDKVKVWPRALERIQKQMNCQEQRQGFTKLPYLCLPCYSFPTLPRPMGEVFELEIDTLETTCHVLDPTPLANCSVRQLVEHAVEGDCDFQVLKQDGQFSVLFAKCDSSPDSAEDVRRLCPGCPLLAPLNDTKVVHAVDVALTAFNAQSNGSYFRLLEVSRAQLVPLPPSTYVEFAVAATDCAAKDVTDPAKCNLLAEKQYGFCKATLTEKVGGEDVAVTCTVFQTQPLLPQPQPEGPDAVAVDPRADPAVPVPSQADVPVASLVVVSEESASGEAVHVEKGPTVVQPGIAVVPDPALRPCPGRIRYFKV